MISRVRPEDLFRKQATPHVVLGAPLLRFPVRIWLIALLALAVSSIGLVMLLFVPQMQQHVVKARVMATKTSGTLVLIVPADDMRHVSRGVRMNWHAAALPRQIHGLFSGTVREVSQPDITALKAGKTDYIVRLDIDPDDAGSLWAVTQLRPGVSVTGTVAGEKRPLAGRIFGTDRERRR